MSQTKRSYLSLSIAVNIQHFAKHVKEWLMNCAGTSYFAGGD